MTFAADFAWEALFSEHKMKNNNKTRGKEISRIVCRAMPIFFENFNHIIHKYTESGYNLNGNQIKVINAINVLESVSPATLSRILNMQKGSLTTIISSLVKLELLQKEHSEKDPRRYNLSVTQKALNLMKEKEVFDAGKYAEIFAEMPEADYQKIRSGFNILLNYLDKKGEANG